MFCLKGFRLCNVAVIQDIDGNTGDIIRKETFIILRKTKQPKPNLTKSITRRNTVSRVDRRNVTVVMSIEDYDKTVLTVHFCL